MAHWLLLWFADLRTILVCAVVCCVISCWTNRSPHNLPPGPWRWPILGSLPNLGISMYRSGLQPHQFLATLSKCYGKVFSLYLGNQLVIILNSAEGVREAFQNQYITDRPEMLFRKKVAKRGHGKYVRVLFLPYKVKRQYMQISNLIDTFIKHTIPD